MKISIIGSGWLAQPLATHLKQDDHKVMLTSTTPQKIKSLLEQGLNAVKYQLGDQPSIQLLDCDLLIIAITSKDIDAFKKLMSQIDSQQTKHLIFISSTSVYANSEVPHAEDSQNLNASSPILKIEQIIQQHSAATIIRFAGLVGPKRHPGRFFKNGKTIKNPEAKVNLIHLDDCIDITKTIIQQNAWGEVFNGCADNHPEKKLYYQTMAMWLGMPKPESEVAAGRNKSIQKVILNDKIKSELNYVFKYPDVFEMPFD